MNHATLLNRVVLAAAGLSIVASVPAHGQAFADLKSALVDYSKSDIAPRKACDDLGKFKNKEIVQMAASAIPATNGVPANCRVSGTISPEIAFEVSLPEKWNGRFYMIGN